MPEQSWTHKSSPRAPWAHWLGLPRLEGERRWPRPLSRWEREGGRVGLTQSSASWPSCIPQQDVLHRIFGSLERQHCPKGLPYPRKFLLSRAMFSSEFLLVPPPLLLPRRLWTCPEPVAHPREPPRGRIQSFSISPWLWTIRGLIRLPHACDSMRNCYRAGRFQSRYSRPWSSHLWQVIVSWGWGTDKFSCSWLRQTTHKKSDFRALK